MTDHPYSDLPDYAYWRRGVNQAPDGVLDPVTEEYERIGPRDQVATAGSCFAQHIGRYLSAAGCAYMVTERAHPIVTVEAARRCHYGVFTARYGNIYTARQLVQLFDRAYGSFQPLEDMWRESAGVILDPFRPNIQPGGFNSQREFAIDRDRHFRAVRETFENLDVFVFTLGLTEAWRSKEDGAVFPICPGVSGGAFSARRHEFVNFGVDEVVADLRAFLAKLKNVNRKARVVLTVSPVPLAATAENRHVLVSTTYSKSVLRVACDMIVRENKNVVYFPSYEIVASGHAGRYFGPDNRSVTEEGVAHVMRIFAGHFLGGDDRSWSGLVRRAIGTMNRGAKPETVSEIAAIEAAFQVMCDEEALDRPTEDRTSAK